MTTVLTFPLPDGPLTGCDQVITERAALIYRMARELLNADAYLDYSDAILVLVKNGEFSRFEIFANVKPAMDTAKEHVSVMREMCQS